MKKIQTGKKVLACWIVCVSFLSGCSRQKPLLFDAQEIVYTQENAWQDEVPATDEDHERIGTYGQDELKSVVVHICGAVVSPGVYELSPGSRIADAVELAGGLLEDADESYVNLAELLADGQQISIPTKQEARLMRQLPQQNSVACGKININTADKVLLCSLPGIGDTRAADIIAYRQEHGGFKAIEDIMQVSGIKEGSFQKIKEMITVN